MDEEWKKDALALHQWCHLGAGTRAWVSGTELRVYCCECGSHVTTLHLAHPLQAKCECCAAKEEV